MYKKLKSATERNRKLHSKQRKTIRIQAEKTHFDRKTALKLLPDRVFRRKTSPYRIMTVQAPTTAVLIVNTLFIQMYSFKLHSHSPN